MINDDFNRWPTWQKNGSNFALETRTHEFEAKILQLEIRNKDLQISNDTLERVIMDITGSSCPYTASAILDYIKEHGDIN